MGIKLIHSISFLIFDDVGQNSLIHTDFFGVTVENLFLRLQALNLSTKAESIIGVAVVVRALNLINFTSFYKF